MNYKYLLLTSLLVIISIVIVFILYQSNDIQENSKDNSEGSTTEIRNEKYVYPIKPGTSEWEKLNSRQEMVDKVQIPSDILHTLSTKALVETVLDYPLLEDYIAYSNPPKSGPQIRFEFLSQEFNGFKELVTRSNGLTELKDKYVSKDLLSHDDIWKQINDPSCNCESINYINNLEYLLAQNDLINQASMEDRKLILNHAQAIMLKKLASEDYTVSGSHSTAFLIAKILYNQKTSCSRLLEHKDISYLIEKGEYIGVDGEKVFKSLVQCELH